MNIRAWKHSSAPTLTTSLREEMHYFRRTPVDWKAAAIAGAYVGFLFLFATGANPWGYSSMIAPTVMGREMVPRDSDASQFHFGFLTLNIVVAVLFAMVLASFVHRFRIGKALLCGACLGLVFYCLNYLICELLLTVPTGTNELTVFLTHMAFALCATGAYKAWCVGES